MPTTPPLLIEIASRHQYHLEGLKTSVSNKYDKFLLSMAAIIDRRLNSDITEFNRKRLEKLLASITADLEDKYFKYYQVWSEDIIDISQYEAEFEVKSLKQVIDNRDFSVPSKTQLKAAVFAKPLSSMAGPDKGKMLESFYRDWTNKTVKAVEGIIRAGFYSGRTTPQIVREIKGTPKLKFRDGQLARGKKDIVILTRTAVQHAASQARNQTWEDNSDIVVGYRWISTLDSRTTLQCASLDGEVFKVGKGPLPPIHPGCRSTTAAALDSRFSVLGSTGTRKSRDEKGVVHDDVKSKTRHYQWLKEQPINFQNSAIGPTRAKLLRNGGLSAERFAELSLDKEMYKPRTLADMKALEPTAFEKAGI